MKLKQANTLDEVIDQLEVYIDDCTQTQNRMGYFATLYLGVTKEVKEGISASRFEDGPRMEVLDVHFANLFFRSTQEPSVVWEKAFTSAKFSKFILVQHLLLGMNAHINFDLALSVKKSVNKAEMDDLFSDYNEINSILIEQIDVMQEKVNKSWWIFRVLDIVALRFDELLVGFSLIKARESAWNYAKQLQNEDKVDKALEEMETLTLSFANILIKPKGLIINTIIWINHLCEPKSVSRLIKTIHD